MAQEPDFTDQIRKLAELRDDGLLTQEEFDTKKAQLIDAPPGPQPSSAPDAPPHGAPQPPEYPPPKRKSVSQQLATGCVAALVIVVGIVILAFILGKGNGPSPASTTRYATATTAPSAPTVSFEQIKAQAKTIPYDELSKNPAALKGQYVYYDAKIFQLDANTGANAFLAEVTKGKYDTWDNTVYVTAPSGTAGIDNNDIVHIWGEVVGSYSYSTKIGGQNSVPEIRAVKVELVQKQ